MHADWVRHIRDRCVDSDVPFFFKQWGGVFKKRTGRTLDGRVWRPVPELPADLRTAAIGKAVTRGNDTNRFTA